MKIQNIIMPKLGVCTEEELFIHRDQQTSRDIHMNMATGMISFKKDGMCSFDTYFNNLSIEKWKKYTTISDVYLNIKIKGKFEVVLYNIESFNGAANFKIVNSVVVSAAEPESFSIKYNVYDYRGVFSFGLKALEEDSEYISGYYEADVEEDDLHDVKIAINICTFKRESFIKKNIDILNRYIIENPNSDLYGNLKIYISDNGKTLPVDQLESEYIKISPNKNVGGAGGFARGMMEVIRDNDNYPATHIIMMDDDITIETESLFRTYALLRCRKETYKDMAIGGSMLRNDKQVIQVEAGASWNEGELISNKQGLWLNDIESCLFNEIEEFVEFNAWWYCCMPMSKINMDNLPLPIFIRGDDVEFGLRNIDSLVLLNGICVWHEAFENKYSSFLQYYILRNLFVDNSVHFEDFTMKDALKRIYKMVAREFIYYRYQNIDLILQGVKDYLKGIQFFKDTDGELLHKEIMAKGYKQRPVESLKNGQYRISNYDNSLRETEGRFKKLFRYITINGYILPSKKSKKGYIKVVPMAQCRPINYYREKKILNYDPSSGKAFVTEKELNQLFITFSKLVGITFEMFFKFDKAKNDYKNNIKEITCENFWNNYLGLYTEE